MYQNYPNPFNPDTRIEFMVPSAEWIEVAVFDILGRNISTLHEGDLAAGKHTVAWNGTDRHGRPVASGVYFARVTSPVASAGRKMVLLR
jgi:flagellar hook assembly protein FlgD